MTADSVKNPLDSSHKTPSPEDKPHVLEKLKKGLFYLLLASGSTWGLLAPTAASAGFFSISTLLSSITPQANAASPGQNSQTVPLLASATNIDPTPSTSGSLSVIAGSALVPQDGPSGTAADIDERPSSSAISVYTVHDGDTLSGIAALFGVSVNTIIGANDVKNGVIHPGDTLIILPITGIEHTVVAGDTLASLAKKYGSDAHDIASYNNLDDNATLTVGATLLIPDGELGASTAPAPSSKSGSSNPAKTTTKVKIKTTSISAPATSGNAAPVSTTEPYLGGSGAPIPGYFTWPLNGGVITQGLHGWNAVDIGAPKGTAIYAAAAGTVIVAKNNGAWNGGYGNYVVISHPNGTQTLYAHMSRVLTTVGASVAQGDTIGKVGETGEATGNHLHFEVRGAENPFTLLPLGASE